MKLKGVFLFLVLLLLSAVAFADEPIAPEGVTYVAASDAINQTARDALTAAFSGDKLDLAGLISRGIEKNGKVLLESISRRSSLRNPDTSRVRLRAVSINCH